VEIGLNRRQRVTLHAAASQQWDNALIRHLKARVEEP
jgi:hypothetical protein